jgi:hypothetical protein
MSDSEAREQRRLALLSSVQGTDTLTIEQHAFVQGLKHVLNTTYMSTEASAEAFVELFPPETLVCSPCLKQPLLYVLIRDVLRFVGITVEQRQGLFIPQAVSNAIYSSDTTLKNVANSYMANYRLAMSTASETSRASDAAVHPAESGGGGHETTWRKIDAASRRFPDNEKYSGILAESPSLAETRNTYLTYCNQKEFSRADRVKLFSCVLKGPALNYWMSHVEGKDEFTELGAVFRQLESQFDTPAHQRQIESLACSMTMEDARKKNNCNRIAALGFLYHEVARLNEQFPKVKRGDQFRTQTLMRIFEKYEWSRTAEEGVMQDALSYDALYTKLSASLVIWEHQITRSGGDPDLADDRRSIPVT